jgi:hypothetical protein
MRLPIPPGANPALYPIAKEFMRLSYDLLGAYLDALGGLESIRNDVIRYQAKTIEGLKQSDPANASEQFMDQQSLSHEFGADQHGPRKLLHRTTQGEFKRRTSFGGLDARLLGYMMVALLYGSWEDKYREAFALALGHSKKDDLQSDLFGDLRKLRIAIIHNHGIATQDVESGKILRWFRRGDSMFISHEHVDRLFDHLDAYVTQLCGISTQAGGS